MGAISMKGGGYYDANSSLQTRIIQSAIPLLNNAAESVPLPNANESLTILDFGCGEGKNSLACIKGLVERIRRRDNSLDISVIQNDLWVNDFNQLFRNLYNGNTEWISCADTSASTHTYFFASGRSFYEQVAPSGSVHIAISSSAVHWLGTIPDRSILNHIYLSGATRLERQHLASIAAERWLAFLRHRSSELVPGGKLVVVMLGRAPKSELIDDAGLWTGETLSCENLMDLMNTVLIELVREERISADRYKRFALPLYSRSLAETLQPLDDTASGLLGAFRVDHAQVQIDPSPLYETYRRTADSVEYAKALVDWTRAWCEPLLTAGLFDSVDTPIGAQKEVLEELYERMGQQIAKNPEVYACNPIMLYLALTKV